MNKKQNLIKLHLITGETVETVEEVISHERSEIVLAFKRGGSGAHSLYVQSFAYSDGAVKKDRAVEFAFVNAVAIRLFVRRKPRVKVACGFFRL